MTQLLDIKAVADRLGVSRRTAFSLAKKPGFPQPVRLSPRIVRYSASDLDAWIEALRSRTPS